MIARLLLGSLLASTGFVVLLYRRTRPPALAVERAAVLALFIGTVLFWWTVFSWLLHLDPVF